MNEKLLSKIFRSYISNQAMVSEIASCIDVVIDSALTSPHGQNLENLDGFSGTSLDRQVSTIRNKIPDGFGQVSEIMIEVFSEGRAVISAARYEGLQFDLQHKEGRTLYFFPHDDATEVAGRVLSAMVDMSENDVAEAMSHFTRDSTRNIAGLPAVGQ